MIDKVPAESINQYYYSSKNVKRSKVDTYQTTNGVFNLNSLTPGSTSTVVISPNAGLSHFILTASLPAVNAEPGLTYTGLALPTGWLYSMIDNITYRYAGSSQWSATGEQLRICAVSNAGNFGEAQQIINLGGNACIKATDFAGAGLQGACVLTLAHISSQSGTEVPLPLDSSLLNGGPITITITWKRFEDVFAVTQSAPVAPDVISPIPKAFASSRLQVRQILPMYRDDLLKMTGDQAYRYPINFYQPENQAVLKAVAGVQTVNLVGFKQGECRGVYCFITKKDSSVPANQAVIQANASTYVPISAARCSYAGTVLHDYGSLSGLALLDTLFTDSPSYFQTTNIVATAPAAVGNYWTLSGNNPAQISYFAHFPFAQRYEQLSNEYVIMNGVGINNGSISLEIAIGENISATAEYTLHYIPYFSAALSFSGGQVDYLF
jgi:hypothetical protein